MGFRVEGLGLANFHTLLTCRLEVIKDRLNHTVASTRFSSRPRGQLTAQGSASAVADLVTTQVQGQLGEALKFGLGRRCEGSSKILVIFLVIFLVS